MAFLVLSIRQVRGRLWMRNSPAVALYEAVIDRGVAIDVWPR